MTARAPPSPHRSGKVFISICCKEIQLQIVAVSSKQISITDTKSVNSPISRGENGGGQNREKTRSRPMAEQASGSEKKPHTIVQKSLKLKAVKGREPKS